MVITIEKQQIIISQAEMISNSLIVGLESISLSDPLLIHLTRYLPPPATSQRVLRGDILIRMEELLANDSRNCPYATGNNAFEVYLFCFSPKINSRSGQLFLSSFPSSLTGAEGEGGGGSHCPPSLELRIHVMDGLNYPIKNKTNLILQFDLLKYTLSQSPQENQTVREEILSTIHTNLSLHPRQLVWDQKFSLPQEQLSIFLLLLVVIT